MISLQINSSDAGGENILSKFLAIASEQQQSTSAPNEEATATTTTVVAGTKKIIYTPQFLLELKESPLIPSAEELGLTTNPYWIEHLKDPVIVPVNNNTRNREWNANDREKGVKGKKNDNKQTANKKKNSRQNPSQQSKRGGNHDDEETPDWMLENDGPKGNTLLDFEKWKLKMKIEGLKRKGEPVPEEDKNRYEMLCQQIKEQEIEQEEEEGERNGQDQPPREMPAFFTTGAPTLINSSPLGDTLELPKISSNNNIPAASHAPSGASSRFSSFFHTEEPAKEEKPLTPATSTINAIQRESTPIATQPTPVPVINPLADLFAKAQAQATNSPSPTLAMNTPPASSPTQGQSQAPQANDMFFQQLLNRNVPGISPQQQQQHHQQQQQQQQNQPQLQQKANTAKTAPQQQYQQYQQRPRPQQQQPQQGKPNNKNQNMNGAKPESNQTPEEQAAAFLKDLQKMPNQFMPPGMMIPGPNGMPIPAPMMGPNGMPLPPFMPNGMNFPPPQMGPNGAPLPMNMPPPNMQNMPNMPPNMPNMPNIPPNMPNMPMNMPNINGNGFPPPGFQGQLPPGFPQQPSQHQQQQQQRPPQQQQPPIGNQAYSANALFQAVQRQQGGNGNSNQRR